MIWLGLIAGLTYLKIVQDSRKQTKREESPQLKTLAAEKSAELYNDRTRFIFEPSRFWEINRLVGNWPWGSNNTRPPTTYANYVQPPPVDAGTIDWSDPHSQLFRTPEFRKMYVDQYRTVYGTELSQAVRNQLVPGFWHETITKGRVMNQTSASNGVYNPDGPNLYRYK